MASADVAVATRACNTVRNQKNRIVLPMARSGESGGMRSILRKTSHRPKINRPSGSTYTPQPKSCARKEMKPPISAERLAEIRPRRIIMPMNARIMPTTSSLRSAESFSHQESARGRGGACLEELLAREVSPFGGRALPADFVVFFGGAEGLRRGMIHDVIAPPAVGRGCEEGVLPDDT